MKRFLKQIVILGSVVACHRSPKLVNRMDENNSDRTSRRTSKPHQYCVPERHRRAYLDQVPPSERYSRKALISFSKKLSRIERKNERLRWERKRSFIKKTVIPLGLWSALNITHWTGLEYFRNPTDKPFQKDDILFLILSSCVIYGITTSLSR